MLIRKGSDEYNALRNQAIHLGATTSFTSGEVAQGQGYLAMAGFNAEQIEKSMPAILAMTKAAGWKWGLCRILHQIFHQGLKFQPMRWDVLQMC